MCEIPEAVQCYLDLIDNDEEFPVCEEQKLLGRKVYVVKFKHRCGVLLEFATRKI